MLLFLFLFVFKLDQYVGSVNERNYLFSYVATLAQIV